MAGERQDLILHSIQKMRDANIKKCPIDDIHKKIMRAGVIYPHLIKAHIQWLEAIGEIKIDFPYVIILPKKDGLE